MGSSKYPSCLKPAPKTDFTVDVNGDAFISFRKVVELTSVPLSTIKSRTATSDTSRGLSPDFLQEVVQYYAFDAKQHCTVEAQQFAKVIMQAGAKAVAD